MNLPTQAFKHMYKQETCNKTTTEEEENINTNLYNENQAGPSTYLPKVKPSDSTSITDSGETEEEMNEKEK